MSEDKDFDDWKMRMSVALGAPVDGLVDKLNALGPVLDGILRMVCETPREKITLLGMYLCAVSTNNLNHQDYDKAIKQLGEALPEMFAVMIKLGREWVDEQMKDNDDDNDESE